MNSSDFYNSYELFGENFSFYAGELKWECWSEICENLLMVEHQRSQDGGFFLELILLGYQWVY